LLEGCPIVSSRSSIGAAGALAAKRGAAIPTVLLVAGGPFGERLGAEAVVAAVARGLARGGRLEVDLCPIPGGGLTDELRALLERVAFDARMHRARALIICQEHLDARELARSAAFELATRARQGGVPAYAVARENALGAFDARMLDLQAVLEARGAPGLVAAGRRLADLV
jgi:hypothetical protein